MSFAAGIRLRGITEVTATGDPRYSQLLLSKRRSNIKVRVDPNNQAIITTDVRRHYRMGNNVIPAVDGISLSIGQGEFAALLGSSGSGKSTLMNLIAGLDRPTSGAIEVQGRNLADMSSEELAKYRRFTVGMVFQSFNL